MTDAAVPSVHNAHEGIGRAFLEWTQQLPDFDVLTRSVDALRESHDEHVEALKDISKRLNDLQESVYYLQKRRGESQKVWGDLRKDIDSLTRSNTLLGEDQDLVERDVRSLESLIAS